VGRVLETAYRLYILSGQARLVGIGSLLQKLSGIVPALLWQLKAVMLGLFIKNSEK